MSTRPENTRAPARPRCPTCGTADALIPIVYGLPAPSLMEEAQQGEVVLGGCILPERPAEYHCPACRADVPPA